jgi:hypothetical protein
MPGTRLVLGPAEGRTRVPGMTKWGPGMTRLGAGRDDVERAGHPVLPGAYSSGSVVNSRG